MRDVDGLSAAFAYVLYKRRNALGLSQKAFAEKAGIERTYVSMLERGIHAPSLRAIVLMAQVFDLTAKDLVGEVEDALAEGAKLPDPVPRGRRTGKKANPDIGD